MSDAAAVAFLVLLGVELLTLGVLGAWVWVRGNRAEQAESLGCLLQVEVDRLQGIIDAGTDDAQVEGLSDEDLIDELLDHPDLDDGAG